ncbi:MAG: anaerobic ribonucleoside-triphosphate reductase activating protein [Candidatus Gastranaerophilales bacterium]|nr:anaerobic ribonucleoside-triphosphate reductase activating protein [Candidatus Gastranaerophilales bacterium]
MNYWAITKDDMLNGSGLRVVLWVAGCEHRCEGCHNPYTWDIEGGQKFTQDTLSELLKELGKEYIQGTTISGGDPLHIENRNEIEQICKTIKQFCPSKDIWIYTGYKFEEVQDLKVMKYIDVLVDGEFQKDLADVNIKWCGSSNQRVISVPETLKTGKIVLED